MHACINEAFTNQKINLNGPNQAIQTSEGLLNECFMIGQ